MVRGNKHFIIPLILLALVFPCAPLLAADHEGHHMKAGEGDAGAQAPVFIAMPGPGKKVPIGNDSYLIFGFDKKPKLGPIIMKVEIFTGKGEKDTSFEVLADSGMPSMRGAHETGEQPLKVSKKGAYLMPVDIVMPGDWEIRITIKKDGKVIFRGSYQFDV
jgi:hypothetical protein